MAAKDSTQAVIDWVLSQCEDMPQASCLRVKVRAIDGLTLAFLPGTGLQSGALAAAYAKAGFRVVVGSRDLGKAEGAAHKIQQVVLPSPEENLFHNTQHTSQLIVFGLDCAACVVGESRCTS